MTDTIEVAAPPAYTGTVFLSYARADDEKPPFEQPGSNWGWVEFFWQNLRWELSYRGLHQAKLWLDRYDIDPTEDFTLKIDQALQSARLIITVLSTNWVQRPWCVKEVDEFVRHHSPDGIVLVKEELPQEVVPGPLKNRVGYRFFVTDATGEVREFYYRGTWDREAYLDVIKKMALWIKERFVEAPTGSEQVSTGPVVYLAAATDELRDARKRIANDLQGAGYVVYPSNGLPDTLAHAGAAIREALGRAVISIHLIGDSEGSKPDGSDEGIVRLQLRIAREFSGVPRVIWVPKWLPGSRDKKRDPFEVLKKFGPLQSEEVYAEEATDLSQMLRARLVPPTPSSGSSVTRLVVAAAVAEDDGLVGPLANRLQSAEFRVKPRYSNDTATLGEFDQTTAVLLLWDKAGQASVNALLDAFLAKHARVTVLWLEGGDVVAKQRFFRDGVYVERLAELPGDKRSARELLVRLEIASPGGGPDGKPQA